MKLAWIWRKINRSGYCPGTLPI